MVIMHKLHKNDEWKKISKTNLNSKKCKFDFCRICLYLPKLVCNFVYEFYAQELSKRFICLWTLQPWMDIGGVEGYLAQKEKEKAAASAGEKIE